jgi:hypothetical protein
MAKITEDELKRLDLIKQDSLEIASILGELTYQKISIENQIDVQRQRISEVKKSESILFEELKSSIKKSDSSETDCLAMFSFST